jgi:hypothetical protein
MPNRIWIEIKECRECKYSLPAFEGILCTELYYKKIILKNGYGEILISDDCPKLNTINVKKVG